MITDKEVGGILYISKNLNERFASVVEHVKNTYNTVDCSGAAVIVIHKDQIVTEEYMGRHSKSPDARLIQTDTQFHVASVRKSYIGFALAYAVNKGYIRSIDDEVIEYLPKLDSNILKNTLIRHLLTHTHGLNIKNEEISREYDPGNGWAYNNVGIEMLTEIVKNTTGKTVSDILTEEVFNSLKLAESGWYIERNEKLVEVILKPNELHWNLGEGTDGDQKNMYVSARDLAKWGYIHLKKGNIDNKQVVNKEIIEMATSLQSPELSDLDLPQNGFLWFVKDLPAKQTEIGDLVPKGSFQILGYTGVTVLVIPQHDIVAVRMFNSFGSPDGYNYLNDIRSFGDTIMQCL